MHRPWRDPDGVGAIVEITSVNVDGVAVGSRGVLTVHAGDCFYAGRILPGGKQFTGYSAWWKVVGRLPNVYKTISDAVFKAAKGELDGPAGR